MTRYAALAAQFLRHSRSTAVDAERARDPASLVPVARRSLAQRRRRLVVQKFTFGAVALGAAAAAALVIGPWRHAGSSATVPPASRAFSILKGPPVLDRTGRAEIDASGSEPALGTGVDLQAPPSASVRIGSADGTVLTLEARGELSIVEQSATRRFSLRKGAVRAQVARLHDGERFLISTDDAEVEVHGTVFRVSLADGDPRCENGRRTRVSVTEGVVSVRSGGRQTMVAAGDTWPACARPSADQFAGTATAVAVSRTSSSEARPTGHRRLYVSPPPPRESAGLAAENDLFAAAVRARRERHDDEALRLFSRLLELAPAGPLAEGAAVQKMKLLAESNPEAAHRAAVDYLARYPNGFARDDARRLAGNGP